MSSSPGWHIAVSEWFQPDEASPPPLLDRQDGLLRRICIALALLLFSHTHSSSMKEMILQFQRRRRRHSGTQE
jgi:hypothetical protein